MLVTHTFIEKSNTIIEGNPANTSLNPVLSLYYGNMHSRCLFYFDHKKVQALVADKTYPDMSKLKHVLKFWNVSDINLPKINCPFPDSERTDIRERATSFDIVFFLIPEEWDAGRGFDYIEDMQPNGRRAYSEYGSNWYYRSTPERWRVPGVYTIDELDAAYTNNDTSIIVATQHFDFGNEQIEVDITDIFNKFITGEVPNYGIGMAFAPQYEIMRDVVSQYAGFFSNRTNTFFEPYVETTYNDYIKDDRVNFYLDKPNRLYFYANVGGKNVNLDNIPTCTFNGAEAEVKQATKGVYFIETLLRSSSVQPCTMFYDEWSNIKYNGVEYPNVELRATTKSPDGYFTFGLPFDTEKQPKFKPCIHGINEGEVIKQGDIRKLEVECKINYTTNQTYPVDSLQYRVYVKTADRQVDVIGWNECDMIYNANYFFINTNELVPQTYYIDIKTKYNIEETIVREIVSFTVTSDGRQPE